MEKRTRCLGIIGLSSMIFLSSLTVVPLFHYAGAAKQQHCTADATPFGTAAVDLNVFVADGGGTLDKYTRLPSNCHHTTYNVGGDPHFIHRFTPPWVVYTQHTNNKVSFLNMTSGTVISCPGISGADDVDFQYNDFSYSTAFTAGTVEKTFPGTTGCTDTHYPLPGTMPNPEGIARSTGIGGYFVVDEKNNKLYEFFVSNSTFKLCINFNNLMPPVKPWFVAVNDTNDLAWVSFNINGTIAAIGTLTCTIVETSSSSPAPGNPFKLKISGNGVDPYVTFNNNAIVAKFDSSSKLWLQDDWSAQCLPSSCMGFGISMRFSNNTYYAAMQNGGSNPSLIVVGSIP